MNIELNFYCNRDEAKITGVNIVSGLDVADMSLYKDIMSLTQVVSESYVTALQKLLAAYNKPNVGPVQPIEPDPIPAPTPVDPKPEPAAAAADPVPAKEEKKPVTMEEVRAALIEVRKTKGTDVLRVCFDSVGAARLTDVDAKDYEKLLVKAKEVLNAK